MINFACSGCGKTFSVKDEFAGRKTKCSKCGVSLRVPAGTRSRTSSSAPAPPSPSAVVQPAYVGVDSPEALPITSLDENRPAKGKKRLLIGLSVGSGVMLIALIVLAIVLTSGGNSKSGSGPPSETEKQGLTRYQVFVGSDDPRNFPSPLFANYPRLLRPLWDKQRPFATPGPLCTDGTSNTILIAEAAEPVPWTKADDLPYSSREPLPKLGGYFRNGFNVALADGSARFINTARVSEHTLRNAITCNEGAPLGPDWPERDPEAKPEPGLQPKINPLPKPPLELPKPPLKLKGRR